MTEDKPHGFFDEFYVKFKEVKGAVELNDLEPTQIELINAKKFKLMVDPNTVSDYISDGIVENVKMPIKINNDTFEEVMETPLNSQFEGEFNVPDMAHYERPNQLHLALRAINRFRGENS